MPEIKISRTRSQLDSKGPIIQGAITHSDSQREVLEGEGQRVESITGNVLFDTGASRTNLDQSAAHQLGLRIVGKGDLSSATEVNKRTYIYEGQVIINGHHFPVNQTPGVNLAPHGLIALIGRDLLSLGKLEYDGRTGIVTFKF